MSLKVKFRTLFPALVTATSPLTLVKTGLAYAFGLDINALRSNLDPYYAPLNTASGKPIVIFADGQSNISLTKTFAWAPNANAKIWNNTQDTINTGTTFTALSSTTIGFAEKLASDVADAFPTRPVYLIKNGYTGQAISHWLAATGAPDMYANGTANLVAALAAIGVTKIDFYVRWQGEADQTPSINTSYVANFATMMGRYWANSYFPRETPSLICSISSTADSGSANADVFNDVLQQVVNADPDKRRFLYVGALAGATYWDAGNPGHPTGQGEFSLGAMGASVLMNGPGRNTLPGLLSDPASGQLVTGNPGKGATSVKHLINNNAVAATAPSTGASVELLGSDAGNPFWMTTAPGGIAGYLGRSSRGTLAAPTTLQSGDIAAFFGSQGYDGTSWFTATSANVKLVATENWTASAHGTQAVVAGTFKGTTTQADCFQAGTEGFGYVGGGGVGGAITQATSKATGVTLNKATGQITMSNAALAAGAVVSFTFANSIIAATDTVAVNLKSGNATPATYRVHAEAPAAGSCIIVLTNISAGSLSEALVLNFNVIKGTAN